jgi:hypothetical protein
MAIADRFAARSEEEIANILCEKDAENTRRSTKSAVKCLQQYLLETNADSLNFDDYSPEDYLPRTVNFWGCRRKRRNCQSHVTAGRTNPRYIYIERFNNMSYSLTKRNPFAW